MTGSTDSTTARIPRTIIEEAAHWLVTLHGQETGDSERAAFADWLQRSPVNVQAYLEAAKLWDDCSHLSSRLEPFAALTAVGNQRDNVVAWPTTTFVPAATVASNRTQRSMSWALAAGIAALLCVAGLWMELRRTEYVAGIGEQRILTLTDGSVVTLNSRSRLRVSITPQRRYLELLEGQALFEVAKDSTRPFDVHVGATSVRAVGTAFDVYRQAAGTVVTVIEGRVLVGDSALIEQVAIPVAARDADLVASGATTSVAAGEQVRVAIGGGVLRAPRANVAAATSWRRQELVFNNEPLATVIAEFNRYNVVPLVLDSDLGDERVNAIFHSTNPQSLIHYLEQLDGVTVSVSDRQITVRRNGPRVR